MVSCTDQTLKVSAWTRFQYVVRLCKESVEINYGNYWTHNTDSGTVSSNDFCKFPMYNDLDSDENPFM